MRKSVQNKFSWMSRPMKFFLMVVLTLGMANNVYFSGKAHASVGIDFVGGDPDYPLHGKLTATTFNLKVKLTESARLYYDNRVVDWANTNPDLSSIKENALSNGTYVDLQAGEERDLYFNHLQPSTDHFIYFTADGPNNELVDLGSELYQTSAGSPVTPSQVKAVAGDAQAKISWSSDSSVTDAVYMYQGSKEPIDPDSWIDITSMLDGEKVIHGLTNGLPYVFAVKSTFNDDHTQSDYIVSNVITPGLPAAPAALTPQVINGQVQLNWNSVPEVDGYVVYMYQGSTAPQDPENWTKVAGPMDTLQYTVSNLTSGLPYVFAVRSSSNAGMSKFKVSASVTPQSLGNSGGEVVVTPSPSPSSSSPSSPVSSTPQKEIIKVDVANGELASTIDSLEISRTRGTDGTIKDELGLNPGKAQSVIDQLKKTGSRTAVVLIPDAKDEVSQWDVKLARESTKLFTEQGIELVISNPNVKVTIPATSMKDRTDDVYFRLVPVKKQETRLAIEQRLLANETITQFAGTKDIQVLGRPMTIETNLQSRPVTLVLPVDSKQLAGVKPADLGVYIEHSNGTKELVYGKVVTLNKDNNQQGIEINVDQFSTFSVVRVKDWADDTATAKPYIRGYADGRFQPEWFVTRAEMAALITRVTGTVESESKASFTDVRAGHWAYDSISAATQAGYFTGYADGSFKPGQGITRAEMAGVLQHLLKAEQTVTSEATTAFTDVKQHWAQEAIARLDAAGVLTGYTDGTFRPEKLVSRAEAVTMINKLIGLQPAATALKSWSDVPDTHWAYQAIQTASIQD
ncbi:S-layer homology domain-containing protein [Paenibacillus polysaccharolyticus]|uniref:S-layer homology domain-containing protein n=1 Tax=Paenibacillus polysaccharolyticus TaxID=582692 RepID=A0A1G5LDP3_9BACL|nr:S-layer homology domain-containing protein [Paenibacillus polysaccharolyticus]SCZ11037.1 S-layer homology domain-containing protein [Paenibacillus polysaccharolyticus]